MRSINNEDGVSELVGAMLVLLIIVVYLGVMQVYEVPNWNKELEIQHFDEVYSDLINLRSSFEDVSAKNIPKTSSLHMGIRYPERFMLRNPGLGAYGTITTYPLNINLSYSGNEGTIKWMNYTSIGIVYEMKGISGFPKLVYENGLLIKDYGNFNLTIDDRQSLTTEDNIFIPVLKGQMGSISSIDAKIFNIQPEPQTGNNQVRFSTLDVAIETRYPKVWKELSNNSRPAGSNFSIENNTNCPSGISSCIKITSIPGYYLRRVDLPSNEESQLPADQMKMGMISIDNSLMNSRGPTGPDGQDMWERGQGRLDVPASSSASQFIIRDITMGRATSQHHSEHDGHDYHEHEEEETTNKLKFSVTDTAGNLWTVEIKLRKKISGEIWIDYVNQKYPRGIYNAGLNVVDGKYNDFTYTNITLSREIDLTQYYRQLSNISVPNILTIDRMDSEILFVNFVIN